MGAGAAGCVGGAPYDGELAPIVPAATAAATEYAELIPWGKFIGAACAEYAGCAEYALCTGALSYAVCLGGSPGGGACGVNMGCIGGAGAPYAGPESYGDRTSGCGA